MTPKDIKLLKRTYAGDFAEWDEDAGLAVYRLAADTPAADLERLAKAGWLPGQLGVLTHDACIERLIAARQREALSWPVVAAQFLAGVSGASPRGCSAVLDFLAIRDLTPHSHEGDRACAVCGLPQRWGFDATRILMGAYLGHSGNEVVENVLIRVEEDCPPVDRDSVRVGWERLQAVCALIAEADADETPSALEKRIAAAKALPKTDKYRRYGILQTLAECGVMPNDVLAPACDAPRRQSEFLAAHRDLAGSVRSDIVLPLAGWRGRSGVDMARAEALFSDVAFERSSGIPSKPERR